MLFLTNLWYGQNASAGGPQSPRGVKAGQISKKAQDG